MALSCTCIYGPFMFDTNVNGDNRLEKLKQCFLPSLVERCRRNAVFQQDGAPAHYARQVRTFLDQQFPGRWLGRNGPLVWAARSPDLTPLDFFVWGFLKTKVYERKPKTLQQLKDFVCEEAEKISPEMCVNAVAGFHQTLASSSMGEMSSSNNFFLV